MSREIAGVLNANPGLSHASGNESDYKHYVVEHDVFVPRAWE